MEPPTAASVEILGDSFRISALTGSDKDVFVRCYKKWSSQLGSHVLEYQLLTRSGFPSRSRRFDIDADVVKIAGTSLHDKNTRRRYERILFKMFGMICDGSAKCYEFQHGEKAFVPFSNSERQIDARIQRFIEVHCAASRVQPRKRAREIYPWDGPWEEDDSEDEDDSEEDRPRKKRSKRLRRLMRSTSPQAKKSQSPTQKPSESPCSNWYGSLERDKDDDEPVKQEVDKGDDDQQQGPLTIMSASIVPVASNSSGSNGQATDICKSDRDTTSPKQPSLPADRSPPQSQPGNGENASPTISSLPQRIAIKKLRLKVKKIQFELDYGDGDCGKQQRELDLAASELEILEMEYEMQYGEEYSG